MHVEHAPPPPFGLELGVVLRKRNEIKKCLPMIWTGNSENGENGMKQKVFLEKHNI